MIAKRANFLELVANIQDRRALGFQFAQGLEQDFHLLRGQNRRWLVHDQQLRVLEQTADDLDPLPFARRQRADGACRIKRQAVGFRNVADLLGQIASGRRVLHPQCHVLGHVQRVEKREMLKHHRDPGFARGTGL